MTSGNPPHGESERAPTATDQPSGEWSLGPGRFTQHPDQAEPGRSVYRIPSYVPWPLPAVPIAVRFCGRCDSLIGHGPDQLKGNCPTCGTPYSFEPRLGPGHVVAGQYVVSSALTQTSAGWSYLARDRVHNDQTVVLAELLDGSSRRFLADLDHPNITEVHNVMAGYLVTEYISGTSLREQVGSLPIAELLAYGLDILSAIGYLHSHGLIAGDLKLDYIVLAGGKLKLTDLAAVHRSNDVVSDLLAVGRLLAARSITLQEPVFDSHERFLRLAMADFLRYPFGSAAEMADQLAGVLREAVAHDTNEPQPSTSTQFDPPGWPFGATGLVDVPPLPAEIAAGLPVPLIAKPLSGRSLDWQRHWYRGQAMLFDGHVEGALEAFDAVCDLLPGELAPKLALAACLERVGDFVSAEPHYEVVWRTDRTYVSAAFGLARVRLAGGDRFGAVQALDSIPDDSPHHVEAQRARITIMIDRVRSSEHEILDAVSKLNALSLREVDRHRLSLLVLERAYQWVTWSPERQQPATSIHGWALTERALVAGIKHLNRVLGRRAGASDTAPGSRWQSFVEGVAESLGAVPRQRRRSRPSPWERIEARIHERYCELGPPELAEPTERAGRR